MTHPLVRVETIGIVAIIAAAAGCSGGGSTIVQPPTPVPGAPAVSCPANLSFIARTGQPLPTATFDVPAPQDGQSPVNVVCTPASGSEFQIGETAVTCEATDALSRKGSCTFLVSVAPIPRLQKTKFLAFGDSITEGKLGLMPTGTIFPGNYPDRLRQKLVSRYEEQIITMVNDAQGGEPTGEGKWRLGPALSQSNPEVLLLLEGTNDMLAAQDSAAVNSATEAIRQMVRMGKSRNEIVFLATLPPLKLAPLVQQAQVDIIPAMNQKIRAVSVEENVNLVDIYQVVPTSLIGADGKHPTPEGHQAIADEFFRVIAEKLEVTPAPASLQTFGPVHGLR